MANEDRHRPYSCPFGVLFFHNLSPLPTECQISQSCPGRRDKRGLLAHYHWGAIAFDSASHVATMRSRPVLHTGHGYGAESSW